MDRVVRDSQGLTVKVHLSKDPKEVQEGMHGLPAEGTDCAKA